MRQNMKNARLEREYTQQDLADALNVSRPHINKIERNRTNASWRVAFGIGAMLGINPMSLTTGAEDRNDG